MRAHRSSARSALQSLPRTTCSGKRAAPRRCAKRKRQPPSTPQPRRNRVPAWASYVFGAEGHRERFLAHKTQNDPEWAAFKSAARRAFAERARVKSADASAATPARLHELRDGGLSAFCKRAAHRPRDSAGSFAATVREQHPAVAALSPRSHSLAQDRARSSHRRLATRHYTGHTTKIAACELNVELLHDWLELGIDSTPHITESLLAELEASPDAALSWRYWKRHGMGRLFADPWASLASMNRDARAVLCFETNVVDLDMSACHHRIALALGERYNVANLEPLREYVADPKAWRKRIARDAWVSERDAKLLGVIFLNLGGLSTWIAAAEYKPQLSDELRAELKEFQSCCERIRDATLARERDTLPASLGGANARTQWSYLLCEREDTALRAIWRAVTAAGARVVMLVYDGLMLLPGRARRKRLESVATKAASDALGCAMPVLAKPMALPKAVSVLIKQRKQIASQRDQIAKLKKRRVADSKTIALLRKMQKP
jgi:hypothetical protein